MSSTIDPAKLKVVDLRSELSSRGLDTKGNKAVLVKRLKDALEQELKQDLPDTSIADTSTEDIDTSQSEAKSQELLQKDNVNISISEDKEMDEPKLKDSLEQLDVREEASETKKDTTECLATESNVVNDPKPAVESPVCNESTEEKMDENGEHLLQQEENKIVLEEKSENDENQDASENKAEPHKSENESEQKGEKRRRTSMSPERSQRRRSKSPIKEDEPALDNNKVQLSWCK